MWAYRTAVWRGGQRAGKVRWTIGAALAAGFALASLFWNTNGNQLDSKTRDLESFLPPCLPVKPAIDSNISLFAVENRDTREPASLTEFVPSVDGSQPEPDASRSLGERLPVTALAQFGNGGPGGMALRGGGNRPDGGGAGNGNQFPGGGGPFGGAGQGTGGVCIATKIQLKAAATADLTDRRDKAVSGRPVSGGFFSD